MEDQRGRQDKGLTAGAVMRPFVPAKDFENSRRFYAALGFAVKPLGEKIAVVEIGGGGSAPSFLLQDFYAKDLAENLMIQLVVQDLDAWWRHVSELDLAGRFGAPPPRPPEVQPWGQRISYLWDPSGVLWHVAAGASAG